MGAHESPDAKKARMTRQRLRRADTLIEQAKAIRPGERQCKRHIKIRNDDGVVLLNADGSPQTRQCRKAPIKGGFVCAIHGGSVPAVRAAAGRRLLAMVEPSLVRLHALIHQDEHMPTALGAIRTVLERAGGEAIGVLKKDVGDADMRPIINIGIAVGGITAVPEVKVGLLPSASIDADLVEDSDDDSV